jgi:hypothetical protein
MSSPGRHDDDRRHDAPHSLLVGNLFEGLRACLDRKQWVVVTEFGIDPGAWYRSIR